MRPEAEGLIERERATADRRQSLLSLTDSGRRALERDMAERDAWPAGVLAGCRGRSARRSAGYRRRRPA
ncbi:hypothetical protein [Streptomyces sp. NPDC046759]|uniref:hypothetical protein n=1 Tax=Streptomyces sp. NPDC046759 TaxID=3155019 RepID=UPI0034032A46